LLKHFLRYNLVGIINTLFGFTLIFLLMALGMDAKLSNLLGYMMGAILSYLLNSRYTFQTTPSLKDALKFFTILAVSYIINFLTLLTLLGQEMNPYIAQLVSGVVYTLSSFLLARRFVFGESHEKTVSSR